MIRAAQAAAGAQGYPQGALYVVATPIGNLADLTLRGIHVLSLVDAIACEDTRNSAALLRHLGLSKPLLSVHAHNEAAGAEAVLGRLAQGQRVAYVSDAGTPAISDPGALLVAGVRDAGHRVIPIPGASSAAAALSVAGDAKGQGFVFAGFLPAKGQAREAALKSALEGAALTGASLVLFEAPHRIEDLMGLLAACAPQRNLTVCRELTKQFETVMTWVARDGPEQLHRLARAQRRGEFVIVVHAADPTERSAEATTDGLSPASRHVLALLVQELPLKQAVGLAVGLTGESRNALYQAALALKSSA